MIPAEFSTCTSSVVFAVIVPVVAAEVVTIAVKEISELLAMINLNIVKEFLLGSITCQCYLLQRE